MNINSTQFAAQIGHVLGQATLQGIWMAIVILWGIFVAAWPVFLLLGATTLIAYRLR